MFRPLAALSLLAALIVACASPVVAARSDGATTLTPAGPRLAAVVYGPGHAAQIVTFGPEGEDRRSVLRGAALEPAAAFFEHPNWSPDGRLLAFNSQGKETPAVALIGADGSNLHLFRPSEHPGGRFNATLPEPLFDPGSGDLLVAVLHMPGGQSPFGDARPTGSKGKFRTEFWDFSAKGGAGRRLSSRPIDAKGPGFIYPYSIAADGRIAATSLKRGFGVVVLDPHGGPVRQVVATTPQQEGTLEPAISPDGTRIVYKVDEQREVHDRRTLVATDLMIVPTSGGRPRLLARLKGGAKWPSWDPSGSRIAFTSLNAVGAEDSPAPAIGSSLMEINPDGTCLTKVFSAAGRGAVAGAAWEPGDDRGIGPISC